MYINVEQDWPAYGLLGIAVFFFIYVIVKGNAQSKRITQEIIEKKEKGQEKKNKELKS